MGTKLSSIIDCHQNPPSVNIRGDNNHIGPNIVTNIAMARNVPLSFNVHCNGFDYNV